MVLGCFFEPPMRNKIILMREAHKLIRRVAEVKGAWYADIDVKLRSFDSRYCIQDACSLPAYILLLPASLIYKSLIFLSQHTARALKLMLVQ